jgi:hypothetical protein
MRDLNTSDLMKCVAIMGKIGAEAKSALTTKEGEELSSTGVGMAFFSTAMKYADKEFTELLADIAEMSIEEFKKQPFDYAIRMLEEIAETQDFQSFLQRVTTLTKKLFKK